MSTQTIDDPSTTTSHQHQHYQHQHVYQRQRDHANVYPLPYMLHAMPSGASGSTVDIGVGLDNVHVPGSVYQKQKCCAKKRIKIMKYKLVLFILNIVYHCFNLLYYNPTFNLSSIFYSSNIYFNNSSDVNSSSFPYIYNYIYPCDLLPNTKQHYIYNNIYQQILFLLSPILNLSYCDRTSSMDDQGKS